MTYNDCDSDSDSDTSGSNASTARESVFTEIQSTLESLAESLASLNGVFSENPDLDSQITEIQNSGFEFKRFMQSDFSKPTERQKRVLQAEVKKICLGLVNDFKNATQSLAQCPAGISCDKLEGGLSEDLLSRFFDGQALSGFIKAKKSDKDEARISKVLS